MRQLTITTYLLLVGFISSHGQDVSGDTYCIKLKRPSSDKYFAGVNLDSIPTEWRTIYEEGLRDWGELLSRFSEEPLTNPDHEIFRSVTFGPFNNPKDVQIMRIEKWDNKVVVTIKLIEKLKDSTVMVHKKIHAIEVWDKFEEVAAKYFTSRPSYKSAKGAIHDGSTTVFEGYLSKRYHFLDKHVLSNTDPDLMEVKRFLFNLAGDIYGVNCKKDTRKN